MRAAVVSVTLACGLAACGGAPRLPPGAALLAAFKVPTKGIPEGVALRRLVVVQDRDGGPRLDRAVVEALRRSGRRVDLLPAGTVNPEAAARAMGADAVVRVALRVRREARQEAAERVVVSRPKMGFGTFITPELPKGVPEGSLYPSGPMERAVILNPVEQHLVEAEVRVEVVRARDGALLAAWRQRPGAYRVERPPPAVRAGSASAPASQGAETVPPAWTAVLAEVGTDVVRWLEAPTVAVARPIWKIDSGPAKAATRRGIDAAEDGDWTAAEAAFAEALRQAPDDPRVHANLAVVLERRGDRAGAFAALKEASRLDPRGVRFVAVLHDFLSSYLPGPDPRARVPIPPPAPASAPASAPAGTSRPR